MALNAKETASDRLDKVVADARRAMDKRASGYRERALKLYPWICGRCSREFSPANLRELTVHHRDHNHDNNPSDGSNWELLCLYCHDNEHQRQEEAAAAALASASGRAPGEDKVPDATHNPFADLKNLLKN